MSMIAKNRIKSTWTPLSNEDTNNKIFEERKQLVGKWFDKWTDDQRKKVLEDLIHRSKSRQKEFVRDYVKENIPALKRDFTRHLPRVLSIYLFSFLDPRSLSRCSRVSWHWRYITELDQLWLPKCMKLGWVLPFMPGQYEVGVWKRNYIEHIKTMQLLNPRKHRLDLHKLKIESKKPPKSMPKAEKPWRGSDPVPKDTWRYNYLENDDIVENVNKLRKKKAYVSEGREASQHARSKVKTGQNLHNTQVRRSHSYTKLQTNSDPTMEWESFRPISTVQPPQTAQEVMRPAPVYSPPPKPAKRQTSARTPRDPPSKDLFPKQPWVMPNKADSDEDV